MSQEFFKKYFLVNISDSKGLEASVIRIALHWRTSSSDNISQKNSEQIYKKKDYI